MMSLGDLFLFFFSCKEVLPLVIIAHKEASLVLEVQVSREAIGREFGENLLFEFLECNLSSLVG